VTLVKGHVGTNTKLHAAFQRYRKSDLRHIIAGLGQK
jgi:hypothetical protein